MIYDSYLVAIIDRQHGHFYQFDPETDRLTKLDDITDPVPKAVKSASWKGLANDRVARHIETHVRDHYKHLIHQLGLRLISPKIGLILGGPDEDLADFEPLLDTELAGRVVGTFHPAHSGGNKELTAGTRAVVMKVKENAIQALLEEIDNQRGPGGRGLVDVEAIYESLNVKQLQLLLIDPTRPYPGFVCALHGTLSTMSMKCPVCLVPLTKKENLQSQIETLARAQGAQLVTFEGSQKGSQKSFSGLAGLRRF